MHVLRDDERAADLRDKRVRIAKLLSAGDYFDQREHYPSFGKAPPFAGTVDFGELGLAITFENGYCVGLDIINQLQNLSSTAKCQQNRQMLTAVQCKMARAALGWGVRELAKEADVSANTIFRFENGRNVPNPVTLKAIRRAFEAAGIRFEGGGVFPPEKGEEDEAV